MTNSGHAKFKGDRNNGEPVATSEQEVFVFPLSFAQQRLWFLDQLVPDNPFYNVPGATRLRGRLDQAALIQSLNAIAARHEALRTTFTAVEGQQPVQVITPSLSLDLPVVDLSDLIPEEREAKTRELATEEAKRPFDLSRGPLLRLQLVRLADDDHVLIYNMHHIVSDGWSTGVLVEELAALYPAFVAGEPSPLPPLPIQYADFAQWQREWLQGDVLKGQLAYWRQKLAAMPEVLALHTDRPRPALQSYRGARCPVTTSPKVTEELRAISHESGATTFMTLLAAFQVLLYRYTGQRDFAIGSPIANRNRAEIERLIGFFVNTLVLRADLSGNPTFLELLGRVKEEALGAYAHQDLPFERLVEELHPDRAMSHAPLVQVMFALQNAPMRPLELPSLELSSWEFEAGIVRFDLELHMIEQDSGGLLGTLEYNADLFEAGTAARMVGDFNALLEGIVADPARRIADLPLLSDAECSKLLVAWNATNTDFAETQCIHQLFEAQVEEDPRAMAVVFEGKALTYGELNVRANQLAYHLRSLGVGPDVLVAVCLERCLEMLVGLVGILKAGGAYVPLDPDYPRERLAFTLQDTEAPVLLTQEALLNALPRSEAQVVCLDRDWAEIADHSVQNPVNRTRPGHLAYVIYTSGSTGRPKGVGISHRSLVNLLDWQRGHSTLSVGERTLHFTSISFDVSFQEIFSTLCYGGALALVSEMTRKNGFELARFIAEQNVNRIFLPFVALHHLGAELKERSDLSLKQVITAGEQLQISEPILQLFSRWPDCALCNQYGPTESHVVTQFQLTGAAAYWPSFPPIGRPIANTRIYIVDEELNSVPIGVPGELYIGGVGLARGYWRRPALTAEKFIPDPISQNPGARLYRTGDLARYMPDGNIEFLGRMDHQVKVRGIRVELGEIESKLAQHPLVREVVVTAREDIPGIKRLVAYLVIVSQSRVSVRELRAFLNKSLPEYMLPAAYVFLDALPLTPNGKVDRKALPAPEGRPELSQAYEAPRAPIEEVLAGIWAVALGIERVGIQDNFFDMGGHSLLATHVVSRIRRTFEVELPLRVLFETPTVAGLAEAVKRVQQDGLGLQAPRMEPVSRDQELPLSFAQQRLWFLDRLVPNSPHYNNAGALRLLGTLSTSALARALNEIVARHEALRTTFITQEGRAAQVIALSLTLELPVIDLSDSPPEERVARARELASEEALRPFELSQGPLLRVQLFRLADTDHVFFYNIHHIVSDGWSVGIFVRELAALYAAFVADCPSPLSPLPIQYADFSCWQREWLQGEVLEKQLRYWKSQLAGLPEALALPTDRPRPAAQSLRGARHPVRVSSAVIKGLRTISREVGATLFMTLMAAFQVLLYRYTGQRDFAIGSPIANRNRAEIEPLIGFFVNTLVLRADLSGNPSFLELVARTKKVILEAYAYQDLPFEQLVEELQPARDLSHSPLFQVMFSLQNMPIPPLELTGLALESMELESGTAKFDLVLHLSEVEGELRGALEYNMDLFDDSTITRMVEHFATLLKSITEDPRGLVEQLPLLRAVERQQIVTEWNATDIAFPTSKCLHHLFETQVETTPDFVALNSGEKQLTYADLNIRANQLARHLRTLGVGPDVLVGICVDRSLDMVVAQLGVLKAGGAYLPVDPNYPKERLVFMLQDAEAPVLLAQERLLAVLPPESGAHIVCLDRDWGLIEGHGSDNPINTTEPEHLAYVIYTSGSTGQPKGVPISHKSLLNLVSWHQRTYGVTAEDRATQLAGAGFDAAAWEVWPYLTAGASIYLPDEETRTTPARLLKWLAGNAITLTFVPTPLAEQILGLADAAELALRALLTGGDKLQHYPRPDLGYEVINHYGPTENTVVATAGSVVSRMKADSAPTIGRPIANTQVYILDKELNPVPIGVVGELHIGGVGLSRGYQNLPAMTAEKFIPHPFSDVPGGRLYRTGDMARYSPDGDIEYLGRIDHQVKVRGFRIELGEIESTLMQHPEVREAVVLAREDRPGDKRLVAYVVIGSKNCVDVQELRGFLGKSLPEYMVPAAFQFLDALPLTPNGKVDREALPMPEARPALAQVYEGPRTPTEQALVDIWAAFLGVERVGIHDNFFELGGDSILSIQILARAHEAGLELTPRQLFEHQTVAELAAVAGTVSMIQAEQGVVTGPVPLTPIQQWFFEQEIVGHHHWNQAPLLEIPAIANNPILWREAVRHVLTHHDALRLRFVRGNSGFQQEISIPDKVIPFSHTDLSKVPESEFTAVIAKLGATLQTSLNLTKGPLIKVALIDLGSSRPSRLLIVIHHLAIDGVSWRILIEDLQTVYEQLDRGDKIRLPPKTTSFKQWAKMLAEYALSPRLSQERDYWLTAQRSDVGQIPLDYARGDNIEASARTVSISLSGENTQALLHKVPRYYGARIDHVLLTALAQAFAQWTRNASLLIDLEGHGRESIFSNVDLSRTVGWFTTIFPVLLQLGEATGPAEALPLVKQQLDSIPNKGIGYGLLCYLDSCVEIRNKLRSRAKAQVSFNYLGQLDQVASHSSFFTLAKESIGPLHSPRSKRSHMLEITAIIVDGRLQVTWMYSDSYHAKSTIVSLANAFREKLRELIGHCSAAESAGPVPLDFPLAKLNQQQLNKLISKINEDSSKNGVLDA